MLQKLSERVRECLRHADDCADRAKREPNPDIRGEFLEMENRWLKEACSYRLLEQLAFLTTHYSQNRAELFQKACTIGSAPEQERQPSLKGAALFEFALEEFGE